MTLTVAPIISLLALRCWLLENGLQEPDSAELLLTAPCFLLATDLLFKQPTTDSSPRERYVNASCPVALRNASSSDCLFRLFFNSVGVPSAASLPRLMIMARLQTASTSCM